VAILHFDSQEEMDAAFEAGMEAAQEEYQLKKDITEAEERVEYVRDELLSAEEELKELQEQLKDLQEKLKGEGI
jgi:predicted  nucleic acid-binding Zn-ribbon protein